MSSKAGTSRYLPLLRAHRWRCVVIFVAVVIEMGFASAVPFSFKFLVDQALIKHDGRALAWVLGLLGTGAVLVTVMGLWRDKLYALVHADFIARLRREMFIHLQRLALDFYARTKRLEIMLHFKRSLGQMDSYAAVLPTRAILPLLKVVTSGVLMWVVDWRLGLAATVLLPLTYIGPRRYAPRVMSEFTNRKIQEGIAEDVVKENVGAQPLVKAFGLQQKYVADFDGKNETLARTNVLYSYYSALVRRTVGMGALLSQVAVMGVGAYMVWYNLLSIGSLAAFQALFVGLNHALSDFMANLPALMQAREGMTAIDRLLSESPLIADAPGAEPCPPLTESIAFQDVSFGFAPDQTLLAGVTFSIPRGKAVAVVGTRGSGTGAIVNILERFYDARTGSVLIDGRDVRTLTQESVRARIGVVFQDPTLLEMSVADNIRCGRLDATEHDVLAAARRAEVHSAIAALPSSYATVVKDGARLTPAQRQRIALARALIRRPDVLVLDDVTSTLDPHEESAFMATIGRLRKELTVLDVSGRLATTVDMDTIIVMDAGRIVEQGSHAELMARNGAYIDLWNKQSGFTFSDDGNEAQIAADRLREFPIFSSLQTAQLEDIVRYISSESVAADRVVVQEGDPGEYFYIIVRGVVDISKRMDDGTDMHVATLESGDHFGEVSLLRNEPRTATVRTMVPTMFLLLHRSHFSRLLESAPGLREALEAKFQQRMGAEQQLLTEKGRRLTPVRSGTAVQQEMAAINPPE